MKLPTTHITHETQTDPDDLDNNFVQTPHLNDLVAARLSRRHFMRGGVSAMAMAGLGTAALSACGGGDDAPPAAPTGNLVPSVQLGFSAVSKNKSDAIQIAPGYTATVIYATGDPIDNFTTAYANNGTDNDFGSRSGDHHDGIHFFGLSASGLAPDPESNNRGILCMNHENITGTVLFMHPAGQTNRTAGARPEVEARKEIEAHGVSVIEVSRASATAPFTVNKGSSYNRRITGNTTVEISGPVRGTKYVKTRFSPGGTVTRGTMNNCGHGYTPWGTYLTAEENWAGYFRRATGDDVNRGDARENTALLRNGIRPGNGGNNRWTSVVPTDPNTTEFRRWDITVDTTQPADGTGDFRNEANTFGYIVEVDPFNPLVSPRKRTAMGRRANEGAWGSNPKPGKPLAFYIGCDSRNEYVYKFVTGANWDPADANTGGMLAGNKYLDQGTIYAAVFNPDGTGVWEKLDLSNPKVASTTNPTGYVFEDLADICVNTRLAAGAAGATRMDRPEWTAVNPLNGEIYITMTENPDRGNSGTSTNNVPNPPVDAANPRAWLDTRTDNANAQRGNVHGHVVRIREDNDDAGATTFKWDIFLFGAQSKPDDMTTNDYYQANVNLSGLSDFNDLSKPDGIWFSDKTGILWIETDDNTLTDQSNAMLLAAVPGTYGDGGPVSVQSRADGQGSSGNPSAIRVGATDTTVTTYAGRKMTDATFKRFLVAPKGAEITGLTETPDGKTLFVNIQHPGENTSSLAGAFESNWPGNGGGVPAYGPGGATARPRSATIMITKNDGGLIGL